MGTLSSKVCLKVNVREWLEFELAYFEDAVEHFSYYAMRTSLQEGRLNKYSRKEGERRNKRETDRQTDREKKSKREKKPIKRQLVVVYVV